MSAGDIPRVKPERKQMNVSILAHQPSGLTMCICNPILLPTNMHLSLQCTVNSFLMVLKKAVYFISQHSTKPTTLSQHVRIQVGKVAWQEGGGKGEMVGGEIDFERRDITVMIVLRANSFFFWNSNVQWSIEAGNSQNLKCFMNSQTPYSISSALVNDIIITFLGPYMVVLMNDANFSSP